MRKSTAAAMRERKGAPGKGRKRKSTTVAASSRRGSDLDGTIDGDATGMPVFGSGFGSNGDAVGAGPTTTPSAPRSGPGSGHGPAGTGSGAPAAIDSGTAAVAVDGPPPWTDGSSFFIGSTNAPSSVAGSPLDFSSWCDGSAGASLIPPFVHPRA